MRLLRVLWGVLRRTRTDRIFLGFVGFFLAAALVIRLAEPTVQHYGDALWYCYIVVATVGFGDIAAATLVGRVATVLLSLSAILVVALLTGVMVNAYTEFVQLRQKETLVCFIDKLERLPELSKEELEELSQQVIQFRNTLPQK